MNKNVKTISLNSKVLDIIARRRLFLPLALIVIYYIVFSILYSDVFLSLYNQTSMLLEFSIPCILAIGCAVVFISGELDLSFGYNALFANMLAGMLLVFGVPVLPTILITLSVALVFGALVGYIVTKFKVSSLIITLALNLVYYGLAQFIFYLIQEVNSYGIDFQHLPDAYKVIGSFQLIEGLNFQAPALYALIIAALAAFLLGRTTYFKQYYYVGNNLNAALLSGIKASRLKILAFVISSMLASFSGILFSSRFGAAGLHIGVGMDMRVMAGVVIGGVSFTGGKGTILGGVVGMFFMICVANALRIANAPSQVYKVVEGTILLLAIIADSYFSKRKIVG
jgi:ribose transport system permease protein